MADADHVVPVALLEEDAPGEPAPRPVRRWRAYAAGAVVLLAVAGVSLGASELDARRAEARRDALAALGWPALDLAEPPAEAWRLEAGGRLLVEGEGLLVLDAGGSVPLYVGVDPATGEERWKQTGRLGEWCQAWWSDLPEDRTWQKAQVLRRTVPPSALVCASSGQVAEDEVPEGTTSRLRVIDLASGEITTDRVLPGALLAGEEVPGGVVSVRALPGGAVAVSRVALPDGATQWERTFASGGPTPWVGSWLQGDVLTLHATDGTVLRALDVRTGEDAPPAEALDDALVVAVLPDGAGLELRYDGAEVVGSVREADGEERFSFLGDPWVPALDDGSLPDRVVVHRTGHGGSRLVALDVRDGSVLWDVPMPLSYDNGVLRLDGVLVGGSPLLVATDLRTGERLWEVVTGEMAPPAITDGTRVAVPVLEDDGTTSLVALELRSGAEAWRLPVGHVRDWYVLRDGTVLAVQEGLVVAYR
jgi:outer membrane protein assembly factor BamB